MNDLNGFSSHMSLNAGTIELVLEGDAGMNAVDEMGRTLERAHESAMESGVKRVVVDVRALEFMNSSCFKKFVTWLARVQEMETGKRYEIRFLSDPKMHWQRRSLHVLQCFAAECVTIDTENHRGA